RSCSAGCNRGCQRWERRLCVSLRKPGRGGGRRRFLRSGGGSEAALRSRRCLGAQRSRVD
ncbi:unnamed protein product, partial [Cladocopium goreaui]